MSRCFDDRRWRLFLCALYTLGIAWLSLSDPGGVPGLKIPHMDKIAHFGVYGIYVVIITWAFRTDGSSGAGVRVRAVPAVLWCFVYGVVMEVLQLYTAGHRECSAGDVAANMLGTMMFVAAYVYLVAHRIIRE